MDEIYYWSWTGSDRVFGAKYKWYGNVARKEADWEIVDPQEKDRLIKEGKVRSHDPR
jgi:hypothetical protein